MMTKRKSKTQAEKVKVILRDNSYTREDDFALWAVVLHNEGIISTNEFDFLTNIKSKCKGNTFEAISRARRKVQEENPDLVSEKVKKLRMLEEEGYREAYGHN